MEHPPHRRACLAQPTYPPQRWGRGLVPRALAVLCLVGLIAVTVRPATAEPATGAQQPSTSVSGLTTTLEGDLRLRGVGITITDPSTGAVVATSASDDEGRFEVTDLPVGTFTITASLAGFADVAQTLVAAEPGDTITLDFHQPAVGVAYDGRTR